MSSVIHTPIEWHLVADKKLDPCYCASLGKWKARIGKAWGIWSVRVENWKIGETQLGITSEAEARSYAESQLRQLYNQSRDTSPREKAK